MASKLHKELSEKSLSWIYSKATASGIKGSTEIYIDKNYVADAAVICGLQDRFNSLYKCRKFIYRGEFETDRDYHEALKNYFSDHLCIFEVKISRADFLKTFKRGDNGHENRLSPIGSLHWIVTPKGLIKPEELPDFWGLLEMSGRGLREIKVPLYNQITKEFLFKVGYSILWRRS